MSACCALPTPAVYQLRLVLREVSPLIWGQVLIRGDDTIADLHQAFQWVLGWTDEHLHHFVIHRRAYGVAHLGGLSFRDDPHRVRLADLGLRARERFLYACDVTDGWRHDVRIEQILPLEPGRHYPVCLGGRRAVPPEGCGGPWAFQKLRQRHAAFAVTRRLAEILGEELDPSQPRCQRCQRVSIDAHRDEVIDLSRWARADRFDRRAVTRHLRHLRQLGRHASTSEGTR